MTLEEALKVRDIAREVDGGCCVCAEAALRDLREAFPEHAAVFVYRDEDDE